jgi:predicted ABC-type sugar transport system permease subunit
MNFFKRLTAKTPCFFQKVRNVGLILAAIGGVLVSIEFNLPAFVVRIGEFLLVAGAVASAVAQTTVERNEYV